MALPGDLSTLSDQELVERIRAGDERANTVLMKRHEQRVYHENMIMLRDHDEANSLTQQTFINAFQYLDGYDVNQKFLPWLMSIRRHLALRRLEQNKRVRKISIEQPATFDTDEAFKFPTVQLAEKSESPLQQIVSREQRHHIDDEIARLDHKLREPLDLERDDTPHQEIARRLNKPVGTIRSLLSRARKKLRERLRPDIE